jgi:hypothetical protein
MVKLMLKEELHAQEYKAAFNPKLKAKSTKHI